MLSLKDQAIKSALDSNWEEAIRLNTEILNTSQKDIDTLKRLAYAYMQSGKFDDAKKIYNDIIELDRTNPIATKNLKKLSSLAQQNGHTNSNRSSHMENLFIQEAGKTKTVELSNIADKRALMSMQHGDTVTLTIKRSKIFVISNDKTYLGMLPDNVGIRLTTFMKGGNEYQACVKGVDDKSITIFIRETKRAKKFINQPSFS